MLFFGVRMYFSYHIDFKSNKVISNEKKIALSIIFNDSDIA